MEVQKKSIKNQVGWIGLGNLINAIVNVLLLPYLARALSVELYGTYGQVLMILGVANVIFAFGLSKLIFQQLNDNESGRNNVANVFLTIFLLGLLGSVLLFLGSNVLATFFENPSLEPLIRLYAFSLLFTLMSEAYRSILTHFYKSQSIAFAAIFHNILRVCIIIISIHYLNSIESLFGSLLALEAVNTFYLFLNSPKGIFLGKLSLSTIFLNMKKGLPLAFSGAATVLLVQTDGIMISRMLDTESYAIYRMGAIPIPFLFIVFASVIRVTVSEVNKLFNSNKIEELVLLKKKASTAIAYITYPLLIFCLFFSQAIISFYLGDQYASSLPVFIIYNFLLFLRINDYRDVLIAASRTMEIFLSDLLILLTNIILNFIFIKLIGINGAALASILSYYLLAGIQQYRTSKYLDISFFAFFNLKKLFQTIIVSSVCAIVIYQLYNLYPTFISLLISGLVYISISYFFLIRFKILDLKILKTYMSNVSFLQPLSSLLSFIEKKS